LIRKHLATLKLPFGKRSRIRSCFAASVDAICRRILEAVAEPVAFNEPLLTTSPSIGVALFPQNGATWQEIYKAADLSVSQAKRSGRRTWRWYVPEVSTAPRD